LLTSPVRLGPALALLLALAGCTASAPPAEPPVALPGAFSASGDTQAPQRWWRSFDDPRLERLVDRALAANLSLRGAWQRLREARAVAGAQSAERFPTLDATAEASERNGSAGGADSRQLGLTAAYEVDLWGRLQAAAEAEALRARASRADYRTAALSLAAEVARTWYRLVEARRRHGLLEEQIATNRKAVELMEARFGTGQVRSADLLRQRQLVESVREQRAQTRARMATLEHQLAVLLGRPPQRGAPKAPQAGLPALPPLPDTGVPAGLVQRRPDVRAAFRRLQAADREVAAAVSSQYPRLSLTASALTVERGAASLYQDWAQSFTGALVAPLIDAGRRDAEVARSRAAQQRRLMEYGQAVLTAFRDVEDALVRERQEGERIRHLREQVRLAARAHERLRAQYFNGQGSYLEVLTALSETQALRRELLAATRERIEYRIGLYRALAGGFATAREARAGDGEAG
jgi:NodT family efflux transporter outer membrane factor (OMF) lipoprotein